MKKWLETMKEVQLLLTFWVSSTSMYHSYTLLRFGVGNLKRNECRVTIFMFLSVTPNDPFLIAFKLMSFFCCPELFHRVDSTEIFEMKRGVQTRLVGKRHISWVILAWLHVASLVFRRMLWRAQITQPVVECLRRRAADVGICMQWIHMELNRVI